MPFKHRLTSPERAAFDQMVFRGFPHKWWCLLSRTGLYKALILGVTDTNGGLLTATCTMCKAVRPLPEGSVSES